MFTISQQTLCDINALTTETWHDAVFYSNTVQISWHDAVFYSNTVQTSWHDAVFYSNTVQISWHDAVFYSNTVQICPFSIHFNYAETSDA